MHAASSTVSLLLLLTAASGGRADPPAASYLFPAGGQRGTTVAVHAGGMNLNDECRFEILGSGVSGPERVRVTPSRFFEGPLLSQPDSQRAEDYPLAMAASIKIANDAPIGGRAVRLWTSQGVTLPLTFVVGDLKEIVESEIDGDPIPVPVQAPVIINGRIYPREDSDVYTIQLKKGQTVSCIAAANSFGSPLEPRLEMLDAQDRKLAESRDDLRPDPRLRFTAPVDGEYRLRISDVRNEGGPAHVYRLKMTTGPAVDFYYPLGGKRGTTVKIKLTGHDVPAEPIEIAIPVNASNPFVARWQNHDLRLDVDDVPEQVIPAEITGEAVLNGVIASPGKEDVWTFRRLKGETVEFDLRALRLASPLLGVLTIRDEAGKTLASAEAGPGDPSLRFAVPQDGLYSVVVNERFSARGGPAFAYRLRVSHPRPDFELTLSLASLTVPRGGQATFKVAVNRKGNLVGPIQISLVDLPVGVTVVKEPIALPNQPSVDVALKADASAKIDSFPLKVIGTGLAPVTPFAWPVAVSRVATIKQGDESLDHLRVGIALPTPFKIAGDFVVQHVPRGTIYSRTYRIERNGYEGPIEVRLADRQARHLQGVTAGPIVVPAGKAEFDYTIQLPPWMETARTCRVCVMGTAILDEPDGSKHAVTYSSKEQNDQIIAVVEPERLSLKLDRDSMRVTPGEEAVVGFTLSRGEGVVAPARVEIIVPPHVKGLGAKPVEITQEAKEGKLRLQFAADATDALRAPLVIRAVVLVDQKLVTAETKLTLLPAR